VRRQELGDTVVDPARLAATVEAALAGAQAQVQRRAALRTQLFTVSPGATARAAAALLEMAGGAYHQSQLQSYVRHEMRALMEARAQLASPRRKHASLAGWWASRPGSSV
jgi:hypothetical protein